MTDVATGDVSAPNPIDANPREKGEAMIRDKVRERYENDTTFRAVVDMLQSVLLNYDLTPQEIREAAMLACVMREERNPMRVVIAVDPDRAFDFPMKPSSGGPYR